MTAPELSRHEGSWVVTHIESGQSREYFRSSKAKVDWFSERPETFKVEPIGSYLAKLNQTENHKPCLK